VSGRLLGDNLPVSDSRTTTHSARGNAIPSGGALGTLAKDRLSASRPARGLPLIRFSLQMLEKLRVAAQSLTQTIESVFSKPCVVRNCSVSLFHWFSSNKIEMESIKPNAPMALKMQRKKSPAAQNAAKTQIN
jgi:hypothetical protein